MPRVFIVRPSERAIAQELNDQIREAWQQMHSERRQGHEISAKACKEVLKALLEVRHWARCQTIHERRVIAERVARARSGWKVLVGSHG